MSLIFKKVNILEKFYYLLLILVFLSVISIVHLINGDIVLTEHIIIQEEYVESFFLFLLLLIGYLLLKLYKNEIIKNQDKLNEAFKYIGQVNVQLQEINKVFEGIRKIPENKKEIKNILDFFTKKTLAIVNANWSLLRVIDMSTKKTLREYSYSRGSAVLLKHGISNENLINKIIIDGYTVVTSDQINLGLKVYFIFPVSKINKNQKILIKAIINQLEMLIVIFYSRYYKKK